MAGWSSVRARPSGTAVGLLAGSVLARRCAGGRQFWRRAGP
ncbi:hypothetical protein O7543_25480 [Solwaraspora sp. WMMA2080]|nr:MULTISPECIES: hypothetical protein [unclassified Solwaraspora]WBB95983.1 hypothetical protein O7553_21895 [Solwaraspora sp. WMMA2059]WBC20113.1 hypothetical protein O7543_25480 [Solwaraspora sp. WMMA2080]